MKTIGKVALLALIGVLIVPAQAPPFLTLEQAEELAVKNHPRLAAASLTAQALGAVERQVRSASQPLISGNLTTVGADRDTSIAAGTLQTSGLVSRAASGLGLSQLVTDFGRTSSLAAGARLRAAAQDRNVATTRAQVLLLVDQAYYNVLAAEAVLKVAQARLDVLRLTLRQVRALAESSMRSTLDVSFAEVSVSQAELALYQAENSEKATRALLSEAVGDQTNLPFGVADVPLPGPLGDDAEGLVQEALTNRPDLSVAKLNVSAAQRFAEAERKLRYPAISVVGAVGAVPFHQKNFAGQYSAAGLNISIPVLNGGLFAARTAEAEFRARAADKDADALALQIAASVRLAFLQAENAWQRLDVTARLVDQTTTAARLAKTRYETGLSGILELTQAQFSQTSAQIDAANAKYEYLNRVANLNYATGAFR